METMYILFEITTSHIVSPVGMEIDLEAMATAIYLSDIATPTPELEYVIALVVEN